MDKTKILFICLGNICRSPAPAHTMAATQTFEFPPGLIEDGCRGILDAIAITNKTESK